MSSPERFDMLFEGSGTLVLQSTGPYAGEYTFTTPSFETSEIHEIKVVQGGVTSAGLVLESSSDDSTWAVTETASGISNTFVPAGRYARVTVSAGSAESYTLFIRRLS